MSTWLTDGSANKIKNSYFQDVHNTGIAIETSGNIIVNGSINSDNVDTNTLTSINGSFTNIDVSQNINFPNSTSITGSNGTIYIDTLDISSAVIRDLSCNDASINILQAGIIQSISADTFDLIPNAINIVNFGTDASYINIGGTNSNVTISNTTINDISATTITSTNIISNDISVNDLSCQTASFTSVDISSIIIHEKIIQLDISDCFVNSFDASFGNISQTLTIDQSGSLIVDGTSTMNKLLNVNNSIGINLTDAPRCSLDISASDAILVPRGDIVQRPSQPYSGMFRYDSSKNVFEGYKGDNWMDFTQQNTDACGNIVITEIENDYAMVKVTGDHPNEYIQFNINNGSNYVTKLVMDASGRLGLGNVNGNPARTLSATLDISGDVLIRGETDINNMTIDQSGNVDVCGNLQSQSIDVTNDITIDGNLNVKQNFDISGSTTSSGTITVNNEKNIYFDNPRRGIYIGANTFSNVLDGMGNVNIGIDNVMYENLSWIYDISFNSTDVSYNDISLNAITYGDRNSNVSNKFLAVGDVSYTMIDSSGGETWNTVNHSFDYNSNTGFSQLVFTISNTTQLIMNEVQVWINDSNVAINTNASTNNQESGSEYAPSNAIDGNVTNIDISNNSYDYFATNNNGSTNNTLTITLNDEYNIDDIQAIVVYSNIEYNANMIDVSLSLNNYYNHVFPIAQIDSSSNYYIFQGAAYDTISDSLFIGGSGSNSGIIDASKNFDFNKLRLQRALGTAQVSINEIQVWIPIDISENTSIGSLQIIAEGALAEIQLWKDSSNCVVSEYISGEPNIYNHDLTDGTIQSAETGGSTIVNIKSGVTFGNIQSIVLYMTSVYGQNALPSIVEMKLYEKNDASGTPLTTIVTFRDTTPVDYNIMRFDGNDIGSYDISSFSRIPSTTHIIANDASGNWSNNTDNGVVDISYAVQGQIIPLVQNAALQAAISGFNINIPSGNTNNIINNDLTDSVNLEGSGAYIELSWTNSNPNIYNSGDLASIVIYATEANNQNMDNMSIQLINDSSINYQYNIFGVDASDIYFRFDGPDISASYFVNEPSDETIVDVSGSTYIVNIVPEIEYINIPADISVNNYYRQLNTIIYENNYYLTAGNNCIFYSTNGGYLWYGTAFDSINTEIYGNYCDNQVFVSLAYSGDITGTFMAVANNKTNVIIFTNPITRDFTSVAIPGATSGGWNSVAYGNGMFIGVGDDEWFTYNVATSSVSRSTNSLGNYTSIAYGNNIFVATIETNGNGNLYYSTDGTSWAENSSIIDNSNNLISSVNWNLVKYVPLIDGGYFSAFASGGSTNYTDSSGGIFWSHAKSTGRPNTYTDLAAGFSTTDFSANYVLVGNADPSYNIAYSNSIVENCINIGNNNSNGHNNSIAIGNNITISSDNQIKLGGNDQELIIGNNLGIGENVDPSTRLHLQENLQSFFDYNLCITYENTSINGYDWRIGPYLDGSGNEKFSLFGSDGLVGMTPYITFDLSNNVDINASKLGIGTIEPASVLHFKETLDNSYNYDFVVTFENENQNNFDWRIGPWIGDNSVNFFSIFGDNVNYNDTIPLFNVNTNGNVGIGDIPSSSQRLLIVGDQSYNSFIVNKSWDDSGLALTLIEPSGGYLIRYNDTINNTGGLFFDICDINGASTGTTNMTLLSDGKLGLGVTNPQNTLDVLGNMVIGSNYAGSESAPTNGLLVEGAMGIGTNTISPDCMLTVVGNVRIQGDLSLNGVMNIINTDAQITEMISITNEGTGPAIFVKQTGDQPVAVFYDDEMPALYIQGKSDASGNIGFNTTDPKSILHFNRSITNTFDYQYLFTFENPSGDDWRLGPYVNNSGKDTFTLFGGDIGYNNTTPLFCVDSSGNVGIGTNTPSYTLDVSGTISVSYDKDVLSYFGRTVIGNSSYSDAMCISHIDYDSGSNYAILQNSSGATYLNSAPDQKMYFSINNDNKMIIDASGNVGIGTSSPTSTLDVYTSFIGANSGLYSGRIYGNDSQIGETGIRICELGTDLSANDTYPLSVLANDIHVMNVTAQGNVGIGTSRPNNKLEVPVSSIYDGICTSSSDLKMVVSVDTTSNAATIQTFTNVQNETPDASSNYGRLALNPLGGPVGIGLSSPSSLYALEVNGTINCNNNLYITSYVGIGTTSPLYNLDVNGIINCNNNLYIGGNVGIGTTDPSSILNLRMSNSDDGLRIDNSSGAERIIAYTDTNDNAYLQLYNSDTSSNILLDSSGNSYINGGYVGIGTTSPDNILTIEGVLQLNDAGAGSTGTQKFGMYSYNDVFSLNPRDGSGQYISNPNTPGLIMDSSGNVGIGTSSLDASFVLDVNGIINCTNIRFNGQPQSDIGVWNDTANLTGICYTSGNVGIGTISPQQKLDVSGQVQATSFNATSDFRLKKDIKPLELCLDKVCNLQGVEFVRKGDEDKKHIGFIAQEIEKIVPEVVTTANDENGYKSVAYGNITALLVEAVKELRQEVKDLRAELQSYK